MSPQTARWKVPVTAVTHGLATDAEGRGEKNIKLLVENRFKLQRLRDLLFCE